MNLGQLKHFAKKVIERLLDQSLKKHTLNNRLEHIILSNNVQTLIDVGANSGQYIDEYYTIFKKYKLQIHSFEPIPQIYEQLDSKIQKSKLDWYGYNLGLGESEYVTKINLSSGDQTSSSILAIENNSRVSKQGEVEIKIKSLDQFSFNLKGKTLMKIDVQGFEFKVLQGAETFIKKNKPYVILEISNYSDYVGTKDITYYLNWFNKINYKLKWIHHNIVDIQQDYEYDFCFEPKH